MGRYANRSTTSVNRSMIEQMFGPQLERTDRIIYIAGVMDEQTIANVTSQLFMFSGQDPTKPIHLVISTFGGYIDEMFSLYDVIQLLPCKVHTIGIGKVMSAGVLILAAGTPGERQIGANARVMMHSVRGEIKGTVFEIINETDEMKRQQALLTDLMLKHTTMTREKLEKFMSSGHDCYITAKEAVELGIVDKIAPSKV